MPRSFVSKEVEIHNNKHTLVNIRLWLPFIYLLTSITVQEVTPDSVHDLSRTGDVKKAIEAHGAHVPATIEAGALNP